MEDLPGVMGGSEPSGDAGNRRVKEHNWTIMFVSEHGRLVHVKHFVRYVIVAAAALIVSIFVSLCFFILFLSAKIDVGDLGQSLEEARTEIKSLVDRNDILLAHLASLEKGNTVTGGATTGRDASGGVSAGDDEQKSGDVEGPQSPSALSPGVAVEDLRIVQTSGSEATKIEFAVRKLGDTSDIVSGRIFVVLEGENSGGPRQMVAPVAPMNDGIPTDAARGQYFSIARYKSVTIMSQIENPHEFKTATVFIFATNGALLYEAVFLVKIVRESPSPAARMEEPPVPSPFAAGGPLPGAQPSLNGRGAAPGHATGQ